MDTNAIPATSQPTVYELFRAVKEHPDFVFGTIFTAEDFPGENVPQDFPAVRASDHLAEAGNEYIADICGEATL